MNPARFVMVKNLIECTVVLDVLLGVHWYQASELKSSINCGEHTAFIHVPGVHTQINIMVLCDYFLWDLAMRSLLTGLGLRLVDLPFRLDMSGPNIFSDMLTSSTVT
jgi:hypothetical protein